jgi:aminoglycoside phosphotransferase (APT) family kinase protein
VSAAESNPGDAVRLLAGEEGKELLSRALPGGAKVVKRRVRNLTGSDPHLFLSFDVNLEWPDGRVSKEIVVAAIAAIPEGSPTVEQDGVRIGVWLALDDPMLPAMRRGLDVRWLAGLLGEEDFELGTVKIAMPSYVPGHRAVIQVDSRRPLLMPKLVFTKSGTLEEAERVRRVFVKVVSPERAERVVGIAEALRGKVPVPPTAFGDTAGVIVQRAVPGRTLGSALVEDPESAAAPESFAAVSAALSEVPLEGPLDQPVRGGTARLEWALRNLRVLVPSEAERLDRIVEAIGDLQPQPRVTVHGDFHIDQVLVERRKVTGIVDIDDVGSGEQADDLATAIGALIVQSAQYGLSDFNRYAQRVHQTADRLVDRDELRRRIAVAILEFAVASFQAGRASWQDVAAARLELAELWASGEAV